MIARWTLAGEPELPSWTGFRQLAPRGLVGCRKREFCFINMFFFSLLFDKSLSFWVEFVGFYDTLAVMMVDSWRSLPLILLVVSSPWHRKKKIKYPWIKTALHLFPVYTEFVEGRSGYFGYTFALFSMIPGSRGGMSLRS
ncbi:hypothetical protein BDV39DRAFT_62153 [Aspergillus sergii]|uniref:Uncharacterized protein n=1 Tax=Aspergillus sergii TaxID=1034303 RepID=A0A5N6X769_9EURO|nr:hypothetical protein BDV39DRAFT_62153 [Aspergillus sergii]